MKRLVLFLMIFGLTAIAAFSQKTETRQVSGFTGINGSSVFNITITKGNTESLVIEADNNVMPFVRSEVKDGVLNLYLSNGKQQVNIKTLKATIVMKDLNNVTLSGACNLTAKDLFTPEKFKADCSGVSKMDVNLNAGQLSIESSGAGIVTIKANVTGDAGLNVSGTSTIKGGLKANNVNLSSSGTCSIELTGSATNVKINASGTSKIDAENLIVKTATVETSGVCKVTVNVTDALKVNSSGVSTVNYKGSPSLDLNSSKMTKINKL